MNISLPAHGIWGQEGEGHAFRWGSRSSGLHFYRDFFFLPLGSKAATHSHPVRVTSLGFSCGPATWGPRPASLVRFGQSAARDLQTRPSLGSHAGLELQSVRCWELPPRRDTLLNDAPAAVPHPSLVRLSSGGHWAPPNPKLQWAFRTWIK